MLLSELQRQMGRLWASITEVSRLLALEEVLDSPLRAQVCANAPRLRLRLRWLHTQYYKLEARLPTPGEPWFRPAPVAPATAPPTDAGK